MQIEGKLIKILEAESGTSKNGKAWSKQSCLIETSEKYNNLVCVTAFGDDNINSLNKLKVNDNVQIWCNVYSREYNGRYFNQIDGWRFSKSGNEFVTTDDNDIPF